MSPRSLSCSSVALAALAACSTPSSSAQVAEPEPEPAAVAAELAPEQDLEAPSGEGAVQDPVADEVPAAAPDPRQEAVQETLRAIWQQPNFQRQLAQNWLRGNEVDPPLTLREGDFRLEVLELITQDEVGKATARLQDLQGEDASPVWDFMLGKLYSGKEDFEGAAREYFKAVNKFPSYRRAWQELGFAQMRVGKFEPAAEAFVEVISLGGGDPSTYGALGIAHFQAGDFASAESAFRLVIMMDPREDRWKQALAESLGRQNKYADSINLIDGLIAKDRDNADLWKLQAYAYANIGDTEKAATNFEIVDRLGAADFVTLSNLGTIYLNEGLHALAVDAYLRAVEREDRGAYGDVLAVATGVLVPVGFDAMLWPRRPSDLERTGNGEGCTLTAAEVQADEVVGEVTLPRVVRTTPAAPGGETWVQDPGGAAGLLPLLFGHGSRLRCARLSRRR